ncbi:NADH dehydrogenase [ubiquinone] 1 beta subcomplex subunit 2, mitochondrial [Cephus cinctus]|uniref:NADH dehydrogenase [ubiquinone] 1 beta subcomplex subunit 2, mitochondrial n=1 Tax=Cephus cinctus TaxID=211228 RepID=A0AAJ7FNH4_CEPCN|nr:NADH dehydrogenase [ubiquinone] 1 beta subcomplex subunit 2, mitochondrial [Cephus cinctus]
MLASRGLNILRAVSRYTVCNNVAKNTVQIRHSHGWSYRVGLPPKRGIVLAAEFLGGLTWWWILYHLYHDFGHIVGEFPYPVPEEWTDEELGIPPEDEDC